MFCLGGRAGGEMPLITTLEGSRSGLQGQAEALTWAVWRVFIRHYDKQGEKNRQKPLYIIQRYANARDHRA